MEKNLFAESANSVVHVMLLCADSANNIYVISYNYFESYKNMVDANVSSAISGFLPIRSHKSRSTKRKHETSSSSSESLPTTNPADMSVTYKRVGKAKKFRKERWKTRSACKTSLEMDSSRTKHLLDVFQKHYKSLVTMIKVCPVKFSSLLFSQGFISEDTLSQVVTGQDSQLKKAALLLCDVRVHLEINPEMLIEFVELLQQDKSFDFLADQMKGE